MKPPLEFVERVTAGASPGDTLPLVIAIHGLGDRPRHFIRLFDAYPAPARVVAPRAPISHGRGYSWFPVKLPIQPGDPKMVAGIRTSTAKLVALTRHLVKTRPTKGRPVVTGFSQGGVLSFALAVAAGDLFARAIPVAGTLPPALWPTANQVPAPVRALHGSADNVVPLLGATRLVDHLRATGRSAEVHIFEGVGHRLPGPVRRAMFERIEAATR